MPPAKMELSFLVADDDADERGSSTSLASLAPPPVRQSVSGMESLAAAAAFAAAASPASSTSTALSDPPSLPAVDRSPLLTSLTSGHANVCVDCGAGFSQKLRFLHHRYLVHGARSYAGKQILPCGKCDAAFLRKTDRTKHTACVHERRRPHKCLQIGCESTFFFSKDLTKHHSTVHERNKPFECHVCDKRFGKREHMTSHVRRVHQKLKPFACEICNIRLASKYNLQGHLRTAAHAAAMRANGFVSDLPRPP